MRRKITAALLGLTTIAGFSLLATGSAQGHGYTDSPQSRQWMCANGTVADCGEIQYEPQSVEGPKGFPAAGPADGAICAGGNSRFAQLDDPRGGSWPATQVSAGQDFSFNWRLTARHSTTDFRYYITKDGYDPSAPLTRADLEPEPFLTVPYNGAQPDETVTHQGAMPQKSGKHLILAVWNVDDTPNAFYACSDVQF
ncbi:lytic polysaccharide monooxygenase auxiliary activity family 9 protein [Streptomyces sp. TP-A0874]|uniref:lytic polysaccharide monooxygenase auxiliary activity family 9 protein n=1 Tax=Streptomyces sp. TP-A0874 TaxID=549819 RepID=UPI000853D508|nr:lytic polysaccharide monooxygenase auxiliary activity family 9 protein [Streptomyces sp. TP-A0874]